MFKRPISTDFAPNVEYDDAVLALRLFIKLLTGQAVDDGARQKVERWFRAYLAAKHAFVFSSGRAAFYFILKSLNLKPGDEVLIQALTCIAVPNSILWAKCRPVYVDIDPTNYNMSAANLEKKITDKSRAVVVQHTFGIPADIEKIAALAKKHNLVLIEDCAHALGALYNGRKVGSFGDASFFSFGRSKAISSVFGGLATTNQTALATRIKKYQDSLEAPPALFVIQQLLHPIIYSISLPLYNILIGKMLLKLSSLAGFLSREVLESEKRGKEPPFLYYRFSNTLARLALHQLGKLERLTTHRRSIAQIYQDAFGALSPPPLQTPSFLRYPLQVKNRNTLLVHAKHMDIYLGNWYTSPVSPPTGKGTTQHTSFSCPVAKRVSHNIVNLPTNIHTTQDDAKHIVEILLRFGLNKSQSKVI